MAFGADFLRVRGLIILMFVSGWFAAASAADGVADDGTAAPAVPVYQAEASALSVVTEALSVSASTGVAVPPAVIDSLTAVYDSLYEAETNVFGSAVIDSLFGSAGMAPPDSLPDTARTVPPFEGDYKILISRPVYASYGREDEAAKWVSAIAEIYTYYKAGSFPRTRVYSVEDADGAMPAGWRGGKRRFSKPHVIQAAKKLGATHIIYQEYLPLANGSGMAFMMELYNIEENATAAKVFDTVGYNGFERGLDKCLLVIADAMDSCARASEAFKQRAFPDDRRFLSTLGGILAGEEELTTERAAAAYSAAERLIPLHGGKAGVQYAAALLAGRAGHHAKAVSHLNAAALASGDSRALYLHFARELRGAGQYAEALNAAAAAAQIPALKTRAAIETALTYKAQGSYERARSMLNGIVQRGQADDGRVFFTLAILGAEQGFLQDSEKHIQNAAKAGYALFPAEYAALGIAFGKFGGGEAKAVEFLTRSVNANPKDENALLAIADIHTRLNNMEQAADIYVNLYNINTEKYRDSLKTAGAIYLKDGKIDKAKSVYNLFLSNKFEDRQVATDLARIYYKEGYCDPLPSLITQYEDDYEAAGMLKACGYQTSGAKKKKIKSFWKGTLTAAGIVLVLVLFAGK